MVQNFAISQGGKISGWITRDGVNPLPGVSVIAQDVNLNARDNEITGSDGRFLLTNLSTGPYTVQAILDFKELSTPATIFASVSTPGLTVFCGTFTVTGALGTVTGSVTLGGQPLQSGVLVVVATGTLPTPLPAISSSTASNSAYYAGSSKENGTYSVDVRGDASTFYTVSGYYMYMSGGIPIISSKTVTNVTVTAGQTTSGVDIAW